jgi:O-antigen ligase
MKEDIALYKDKVELIDKFLSSIILLIPLSLAISIFLADLFTSISGIILILIIIRKKNTDIFLLVKKEIIFFVIFYLIILTSLIFTNFKEISFLPSFFYFRYFLLTLSIFYLLKKYDFFLKIFCNSILLSILIVVIDSFIQLYFGYNLFGYEKTGHIGDLLGKNELIHITGFFDEEKKLGSYLVRFLPLVLGIIYLYHKKVLPIVELSFIIAIGILVYYASERTALFLLLIIYFCYFFISNKKIYFITAFILISILLFSQESQLNTKYLNFTLQQTGLEKIFSGNKKKNSNTRIRYYSEEHENLSYTGIEIFKKNYLFGAGIKSFYHECSKLVKDGFVDENNKRNNKLVCSTHPHNTYLQILSEIGIFGFLIIIYLFFMSFFTNLKILFKKNKSDLNKAYFFINLSIIINLMPLIPSGSFFNNWISLMIFFSLGFWVYIKDKIKQ